jgi:hypothetical protein
MHPANGLELLILSSDTLDPRGSQLVTEGDPASNTISLLDEKSWYHLA